jgi:hypothetical protein
MKSKPVPVFSWDPKIADEESFRCACEVEYPNYFIDLGDNGGADGT